MTSELEIGGRVRKLCFTKVAFLDYLNKIRKKSPLVNGEQEDSFKNSENVIWAGLMCQCRIEGIEPDFTREDIEKWLPLTEVSDFKAVMKHFNEAMADKEDAEAGEALALPSLGTS